MFLFEPRSDKRGAVLFSIKESGHARSYVRSSNPIENALVLTVVVSVFAGLTYCFLTEPIIALLTVSNCAVFVIVVIALVALISFVSCRANYTHYFFERAVRLDRGYSRRPYQWIDPEDILCLGLEEIHLRNEPFHMVKIYLRRNRPWLPGYPWTLRFGTSDKEAVTKLKAWARERGISVSEGPIKGQK